MNILHVCKKYPQAMGGDAVVVSHLQKHQRAAGHHVAIVTTNCKEIIDAPYVYKYGIKDTPANLDAITLRRVISLLILFFRSFAIIRQERPQVIHTHSIDMAFFVSFAARFYGVPIVHTFHIVTFYDADQSVIRRKAELWMARRAKLHIMTAPNTHDVEQLQAAGMMDAVVMPNGVDAAFWQADGPHVPNDMYTFLTVGRLEPQKGYEYLIKATALLRAGLSKQFRVIIVGEGSQKETLKKCIDELHLQNIISLVGRKSPEEIRTLLGRADAAVFSSLYETTPITMLEAWSVAVPVIVTKVGLVRDAPTDFNAAYIVPPKDEHSLMHAMRAVATDAKLSATMALKGQKEAQKYSWPHIAQLAQALYRSTD